MRLLRANGKYEYKSIVSVKGYGSKERTKYRSTIS